MSDTLYLIDAESGVLDYKQEFGELPLNVQEFRDEGIRAAAARREPGRSWVGFVVRSGDVVFSDVFKS